jgi:hypothetical protein
MEKTLGLRPADVNHLIYKAFAGTAAGKWLPGASGAGRQAAG